MKDFKYLTLNSVNLTSKLVLVGPGWSVKGLRWTPSLNLSLTLYRTLTRLSAVTYGGAVPTGDMAWKHRALSELNSF